MCLSSKCSPAASWWCRLPREGHSACWDSGHWHLHPAGLPLLGWSLQRDLPIATLAAQSGAAVVSLQDMAPYVPKLMPKLKDALVDPLPEVRATAAKALGSLLKGMGEEYLQDILPYLMQKLKSEVGGVGDSACAPCTSTERECVTASGWQHRHLDCSPCSGLTELEVFLVPPSWALPRCHIPHCN